MANLIEVNSQAELDAKYPISNISHCPLIFSHSKWDFEDFSLSPLKSRPNLFDPKFTQKYVDSVFALKRFQLIFATLIKISKTTFSVYY